MSVRLLGFLREGVAAGLTQRPGPQVTAATIAAEVEISGLSHPIASPPMALAGPGDVAALDPSQILAETPAPESLNAEPGQLASVDFARADLPWLFTPFGPANDRLEPWLVLVVVERTDAVSLDHGQPNGRIVTPVSELPDLSQSPAWAHAQIPDGPGTALEAYRANPGTARARLICPRKLLPGRRYAACLVPAFRAGVAAGLDQPTAGLSDPLGPAWTAASPSPVTLPVYHSWTFETAAGGDFATLVRKLTPVGSAAGLGTATMQITRPHRSPIRVAQDGVLAPARPRAAKMNRLFSAQIEPLLDRPGVLGPPSYGRWHAGALPTTLTALQRRAWLRSLNLDARRRVAAALGSAVVQKHQNAFMTAIWEQAGEIARANAERRKGAAALAAALSLYKRRIGRRIAEGDLALLCFAAPALSVLRYGETETFTGRLQRSCFSPLALGGATQKMLRANGPLQRRMALQLDGRRIGLGSVLALLAGGALRDAPPPPSGARVIAASALRRRIIDDPFGTRPPHLPPGPLTPSLPNQNDLYQQAAEVLALAAATARPSCEALPGDLIETLGQALDPSSTLPRRITLRAKIPKRAGLRAEGLEDILIAPRLPVATSRYLTEETPDWILPGIGQIEPESIFGFVPNPAFIEAYFAGLNHEIAREMLWRGFPTDQRGTVFDSFWLSDDRAIPPMHGWSRALGRHLVSSRAGGTVVLVRGELIRKYPNLTVFLQPATGNPGQWLPNPAIGAPLSIAPDFAQSLTADTRLFGFPASAAALSGTDPAHPGGYFLVFQENPQALRFAPDGAASFDAALHVQAQGETATAFAGRLRRPALRAYVHASRFFAV